MTFDAIDDVSSKFSERYNELFLFGWALVYLI